MAFIYWIFIQIWAPHAMWTTSKLLFLLPYVFSVNFFLDVCFLLYPINCYFYNLLTWFALIREETRGFEENQPAENKFVPLSQRVLSCAAHPLSHTIIAGTQVGPYFIIWLSVSISNIIWFRKWQAILNSENMHVLNNIMSECLYRIKADIYLFLLLSIIYRYVQIHQFEWD